MTEVWMYAPLRGPCHYVTLTRTGLSAGVALEWRPSGDVWRPRLLFIDRVLDFEGNRLNGYRQVLFSALHPDAFLALFGSGVRSGHAGSGPGEDYEELG